jgi:hypothetical protein
MSSEVWTFRESTVGSATGGADVVGYGVEALDGSIGTIDEATYDAGSAYVSSIPALGSSARRSCCPRESSSR